MIPCFKEVCEKIKEQWNWIADYIENEEDKKESVIYEVQIKYAKEYKKSICYGCTPGVSLESMFSLYGSKYSENVKTCDWCIYYATYGDTCSRVGIYKDIRVAYRNGEYKKAARLCRILAELKENKDDEIHK